MFDVGPLKILIIGSSAHGKTQLMKRYCDNSFDYCSPMTIGVDFKIKIVDIDGLRVKLHIWDSAGAERFISITTAYFRGTHGMIIVCDSTDEKSIKSADFWVKKIRDQGMINKVGVVIVGNKCDLDGKVPKNEAKRIALENGLHYFEVSAKDGKGVDESFYYVATLAYHLKLKRELEEEEKK